MPAQTLDQVCATYVDAATLSTRPGVVFVGPYGQRVSFASQQRRALNTVWAIEQANRIKSGSDVAVIGGGLAGLTVAAALLARNCIVWMYEAKPNVLVRQAQTKHRFIHPTVNFWPERGLSGTTQFPFFDWYSSYCSGVIDLIEAEWIEHFRDNISETYFRTKVTDLGFDVADDKVVVTAVGSGPASKKFDQVFVATGFGDEKEVEGALNIKYWDKDEIDVWDDTGKAVFISGTGDGGLIDALRFVHAEFDRGRLPVTLATALSGTGLASQVAAVESGILTEAKGDPIQASELYSAHYSGIVEKMTPALRKILSGLVTNREVTLVGQLPAPYAIGAAPIHKLMIAHAMMNGALDYRQGTIKDGPEIALPDGSVEDLSASVVLVRHGPVSPLIELIGEVDDALLKDRQNAIRDLVGDPPCDGSYWRGLEGYPEQEILSPSFACFRFPLAAAFMAREYKASLAVDISAGPVRYITAPALGVPDPGFAPPGDLFGVPMIAKTQPVAEAYAW